MKPYLVNPYEIGVDEAGRGPLIGRVYAAAVCIGEIEMKDIPEDIIIKDSKKMSRNQRQKSYEWITKNVKDYSIAYAEPFEIDSINILNATNLAMKRALKNIKVDINDIVIDGPRWEDKFKENKNANIKSIIKGDSKYLSIAAASILAKEAHDNYILQICCTNPELNEKYDLLKNMGYGTKKHIEGIKKYGTSEYHRKSFKPIKK